MGLALPPSMALPKVSLMLRITAVLGVAGDLEDLLLQVEGALQQHRRSREVADDELVAQLGERRRGGDVHHQRHALLLGHLGDGDGLARSNAPTSTWQPASTAFSAWVRAASGLVSVS